MLEQAYIAFCTRCGKPFRSAASGELKTALRFLGWRLAAEDVVGAGKAVMLLGTAAIAATALAAAFMPINPLILVLLVPLAILGFYAITEWPKNVARERAVAALATSPHLIAQLAIPLKQAPNLERTLAFAAEAAEGPIADDIRSAVWRMWAGKLADPIQSLTTLGRKWGTWSEGFQHALGLIRASFHAADKREKAALLDASIATAIEDIVARMREYVQALNMPTLLLFSIGMVVPLMIVAMFPLVALFGFTSGAPLLAAFLVLSLAGTYLYSNVIIRKRPPALSKPGLTPATSLVWRGATVPAAPFAVAIGILIAAPGVFYLLGEGGVLLQGPLAAVSAIGTIIILWAVAVAISIYCYGTARAADARRRRAVALEAGFVDSLTHIRNRLVEGQPLEAAVDFAASLSSGEARPLFRSIAGRMHASGQPFELVVAELDTASTLVKSTLKLLATSVCHGMSATAQTTAVIAAYLKKMASTERLLRVLLQKSLSMMRATAITLAPVVCAIIIVLYHMIAKTVQQTQQQLGHGELGDFLQVTISPELLQLVVGLYMLGLNFVLLRFVSHIQHGPDSVPFRMALASAMPIAMGVFTVALIAARLGLASFL